MADSLSNERVESAAAREEYADLEEALSGFTEAQRRSDALEGESGYQW